MLVTFLGSGDTWDALYIDGKLVYQGSDLTVLKALTIVSEACPTGQFSVEGGCISDEELAHLEHVGWFPETLEELEGCKW